MLDFVSIEAIPSKKSTVVYPEFIVKKSKDLMIKGKSFYAVWDEELGFWSKNENDIQRMIDQMIFDYAKEHSEEHLDLKLLKNFSSQKWTAWQKYCKSLPDNFHELDSTITFSNMKIGKKDYVTRTLPYPLEETLIPAYEELMSTLYSEEEREKLEWAIGAVISGDSKKIQKFIVLYGGPGTGKSTVLNIIQDLFPGYYSVFDSRSLSSSSNAFALEAFRDNPLIAIQHDGDLSKIEDNTKINSIVSHEKMTVNEKFKATYSTDFNTFLFMGTNKPVRITDAKSGILRRLIDVTPTGDKIPRKKFNQLIGQIKFELSGIAYHCLQVYKELGMDYYDDYLPTSMMGETNDFYNFMEYNYDFFAQDPEEGIALKTAWLRYKDYCSDANVAYPYSLRAFKTELKNYFKEFYERYGDRRSVYIGFEFKKFESKTEVEESELSGDGHENYNWLDLQIRESLFDIQFAGCYAQYATKDEIPSYAWNKVKTTLKDIDTSKLHYIKIPEEFICIDFDLKDKDGNKCLERNLEAASKWPATYAELSKGGAGIHLIYHYEGDVSQLSRVFSEDVEVKVFSGKSSLRRKLTKCNNVPIASISSGLPLKEKRGEYVLSDYTIKSEKDLRERIKRNLRKEIHQHTKPSVDFIYKILEDAYNQGLKYDVTDMRQAVQAFALDSSHQAEYCLSLVSKMKFRSEEGREDTEKYSEDTPIVFFDVEVFPNLFVVCWKKQGKKHSVVRWINPSAEQIQELVKFKLVGFNNLKYDNHILWAKMMGYTEKQLYLLSQRIIVEKDRDAFFWEAYNLSYTDIYDFLSAVNKKSLKKWEIELGILHMECPYPWDQPVPEEHWDEVAEYCENDVIATEKTFDANQGDWIARQILADWAGMPVNTTTNNLTIKIITEGDPNPQSQYVYTDLSTIFPGYEYDSYGIDPDRFNEKPKNVQKSIYMGEAPSEGGYVWARPGMYRNIFLFDVESMHPSSGITLNIFGDKYTKNFKALKDGRLAIKHKDLDEAKEILPEKVHKYLSDVAAAKGLAGALKTAINAVYGLTSATFPNKLKDPRNKDNIVAKYGALFMISLKNELLKRGANPIHIKTDSIKVVNPSKEIYDFIMEYGERYGYKFNHEATYSKMCLVNDAVYIAEVVEEDGEKLEKPHWSATGAEFAVPYVFKTLFSKEKIEFLDLVETKSVTTSMYLDMNEKLPEEEHDYRFVGKIGSFCPVKEGCNGGILLRKGDGDKYGAVTGTKKNAKESYRWMEAEMVDKLGNYKEIIDYDYFNSLVDSAVEHINKFGDFEMFVSNDSALNDDWIENWINLPPETNEQIVMN